ncbi:MAG: oxidoreductase [Thalassobius sp.]|nr:oxidoreductase [Thalassovita sp.]
MIKYKILCVVFIQFLFTNLFSQNEPLKIGVVGLTHSHVHGILNSNKSHKEFEIVGIVEPNKDLAKRYSEQYNYSMDIVYNTIEEMIKTKKPEAVTAFGNIYDHLKIVEVCAPAGIHVMVEKPLAVSLDHAKKMEKLVDKHGIHLLTNFETTWYPTNQKAYELIQQDTIIGDLRKIVVRDGHKGPKKIGVNKEFLEWLTDPELNGGGAITDFGCYGANLLTWIMEGKKPNSVTAITAQQQPENNPKVDDEAIILLSYDNLVAIIQASWNWPIGRKDMEIYGLKGAIYSDNKHDLRVRTTTGYDSFDEEQMELPDRKYPYNDPFVYLTSVIHGDIKTEKYDLSSLENNLIVVEILDAAIRSAQLNKTIELK